jgi:hypothetical protein
MTIAFTGVGEHRQHPLPFFVVDADGLCDEHNPAHDQIVAIEPDEHWDVIPDRDDATAEPSGTFF